MVWIWISPECKSFAYCAIADTEDEARRLLFERYTTPSTPLRILFNGRPRTVVKATAFAIFDLNETSGLI